MNPPPPPERPSRLSAATVTYPTTVDAWPAARPSAVTPDSIPPLPAPLLTVDTPVPVRPLRPGIYAPPPGHRRRGSGPPNFFLRRVGALAGLIAIGGVSFAGYSVARPGAKSAAAVTRTVNRTGGPRTGGPGAPGPATPAAAPTRLSGWLTVPPTPEPGGGTTLFPSHRLVAYYGVPNNPALGVLGEGSPDAMWSRVAASAAPYAQPSTTVVPSYELIAYTAEAAAGPDGTYAQMLSPSEIEAYRQVVDAHDGMLILDIQPGRSNFLDDAKTLEPWLTDPHVGLALDPEWELQPGQLPAVQVGHTTAAEINQVSAWLQQLTVSHNLPQKLLLIHQFQTQMIRDKPDVIAEPDLATAFNMDGFGPSENKQEVYNLVAGNYRWALGYKLFYQRDQPLQTPQDVLGLQPAPSVVEYE